MSTTTEITQLRKLITTALMAAFIVVGAYVIIPIGPVPVSLQTFFVLLTGLLLSPRWALTAVALYLFAGIIGLPVFAGGAGGIGRIAGPTGGYLIGCLPAAGIASLIHHLGGERFFKTVLALVVGTAIFYATGVPWLKMVTAMPWSKAVAAGMLPFLIGDALKLVATLSVYKAVRPMMRF
jgi:biotin transport system substrate-specific component